MLQELRFWNLVTACVWHAAASSGVVRSFSPVEPAGLTGTCLAHRSLACTCSMALAAVCYG